MSKYLPQAAVVKENYLQMVRRLRIEDRYATAIKGFQEELKTKSTVLPAMRALGLSAKHAVALEMRLQWQNEQAEEAAKRKAAQEEKLAALKAEAANEVLTDHQETLEKLADAQTKNPEATPATEQVET